MRKNSKITKRVISFALTIILALSMVPMSAFSAFAAEPDLTTIIDTGEEITLKDKDGDGYYEIRLVEELYAFAAWVRQGQTTINAELLANIESPLLCNNKRVKWTPIGSDVNKYAGIFNGNNHTISNLTFENRDADGVGLFGSVDKKGVVKNVLLKNSTFIAGGTLGGIVGDNYGTIENCKNQSIVNGYKKFIGGITGTNRGTIINCSNTGRVIATNTGEISATNYFISGIAGFNYSKIINCYNEGEIRGADYCGGSIAVGGIVGRNRGKVTNCYNTGAISGGEDIGGISGDFMIAGKIENCYNTGKISGKLHTGGIAGYNNREIVHCYYLETACKGGINSNDVTGLAEAKKATQFASGEVAYLLQSYQKENVWGQTIGTNKTPLLNGEKVYKHIDANGKTFYTNNAVAPI